MAQKVKDFIVRLDNCVGRSGVLETREGIRRSGKLTAIRYREVSFNGDVAHQPHEIILDGDEQDPIPWLHIVAWNFQPAPYVKPAKVTDAKDPPAPDASKPAA
jgi:hypothetical protein